VGSRLRVHVPASGGSAHLHELLNVRNRERATGVSKSLNVTDHEANLLRARDLVLVEQCGERLFLEALLLDGARFLCGSGSSEKGSMSDPESWRYGGVGNLSLDAEKSVRSEPQWGNRQLISSNRAPPGNFVGVKWPPLGIDVSPSDMAWL
jgi:hypothetical protein